MRRRRHGGVPRGRGARRGDAQGVHPQGHDRERLRPVLCGSAFKNKGVQPMLDAVVDYLPVARRPPDIERHRRRRRGEEAVRKPSDDEAFSALAFKVHGDPFVGSLTFCRVYSGARSPVRTRSTRSRARRSASAVCFRCTPTSARTSKARVTGDIVAIAGLKDTTTGDTLCDQTHQIILERMEFPDPVIKVAIEPKTKADLEKMSRVSSSSRRRIRPSTSPATRRPTRPSSRAWASSTSTSSSTASSASSRLRRRRRPAGELPRVHLQGGVREVHAQEAVRRLRAVRGGADQVRAARARVRVRVRRPTSRAAPCRRSTSPASRRASRT